VHHRRAVYLLAWTRYCCAAALSWVALASPDLLTETGKSTLTSLKTDPLAKVGALAENIGHLVASFAKILIGRESSWLSDLGHATLTFLLFAGATVVWRLCFRPLWEWWDRALLIDVARSENSFGAYGQWLCWPAIGFLPVLPALVLLVFWRGALASVEGIVLMAGGALVAALGAIG
jgi:hypothetical protein